MPTTEQLHEPQPWRAAAAGLIAGCAASWLMTRYQMALSGRGLSGSATPQNKKPVEGRDDATMKAANESAKVALGRPLTRDEKTEVGGPLMHYALGATAGAAYGVTRELAPDAPFVRGGPFGVAVWILADQIGLPITGLSPFPLRAFPLATNLQHLGAHLIYGVGTAMIYPWVRRLI